jgi:hypothetical protein
MAVQLESPLVVMDLGGGHVAALRGEVQTISLSHPGRRSQPASKRLDCGFYTAWMSAGLFLATRKSSWRFLCSLLARL